MRRVENEILKLQLKNHSHVYEDRLGKDRLGLYVLM